MTRPPFDETIGYVHWGDDCHISISVTFDSSTRVTVWNDELTDAVEYVREAVLLYAKEVQKEELP